MQPPLAKTADNTSPLAIDFSHLLDMIVPRN
jgi:hypothetical protein